MGRLLTGWVLHIMLNHWRRVGFPWPGQSLLFLKIKKEIRLIITNYYLIYLKTYLSTQMRWLKILLQRASDPWLAFRLLAFNLICFSQLDMSSIWERTNSLNGAIAVPDILAIFLMLLSPHAAKNQFKK